MHFATFIHFAYSFLLLVGMASTFTRLRVRPLHPAPENAAPRHPTEPTAVRDRRTRVTLTRCPV